MAAIRGLMVEVVCLFFVSVHRVGGSVGLDLRSSRSVSSQNWELVSCELERKAGECSQ